MAAIMVQSDRSRPPASMPIRAGMRLKYREDTQWQRGRCE